MSSIDVFGPPPHRNGRPLTEWLSCNRYRIFGFVGAARNGYAASFLLVFTNGFTYCGGIGRPSCSNTYNSRTRVDDGAQIIGGSCGIGPRHIEALATLGPRAAHA